MILCMISQAPSLLFTIVAGFSPIHKNLSNYWFLNSCINLLGDTTWQSVYKYTPVEVISMRLNSLSPQASSKYCFLHSMCLFVFLKNSHGAFVAEKDLISEKHGIQIHQLNIRAVLSLLERALF